MGLCTGCIVGDVPLHAIHKSQEEGFACCSLTSTCLNAHADEVRATTASSRTATNEHRSRPTVARRSYITRTPWLCARNWLAAVAFLAVACWPQVGLHMAHAQEDGGESELCACNPSIYQFTLDFAAICPPPGIEVGPETGIDEWFCRTDADDDSVTDLIPVSVTSYIVLELDKELQVIKQFFRGDLDLQDGDTFEYTSITAGSKSVSPDEIPGAMQMALTGLNAQGDEVTSQWIVTFTNNCDVLPFEVGDSMSWAIMSDLIPPRPDLCPASPATPFPTETPLTLKPISLPTAKPPTKSPVREPTVLTPKPTKKPTPAMSMRMRELGTDWFDIADLGIEDLQGDAAFGDAKKEEERQRLGLGGLDRRILKRRRRQQQQRPQL